MDTWQCPGFGGAAFLYSGGRWCISATAGKAHRTGILKPLTPGWVLTVVGLVVFVVAFTLPKTYWLMYGLYTFSLVMLLAAPGQDGVEAEERGFQILAGIGLLVVGLAVVHTLANRLATRDPQPELTMAA